jgi:hypothetical protein
MIQPMSRQKLLIYIAVNVIVSAAVALLALYVYDHYIRVKPPLMVPVMATPLGGESGDGSLDIVSILGAGILENEVVQLHNSSSGSVNLEGWKLQNAAGSAFTFPALTLLNGGSVNVHSIDGENTVVDLFWGLSRPAWKSGEMAALLDADGNVQALFRIP